MNELFEQLPPGWRRVVGDGVRQPYWAELERFVADERATKEVYPAPENTFAAFKATPFKKVSVVILGQDPYPNPGDATGLAFAVPPGRRPPTSLANIHAALRAEEITPPEDLADWAQRGVLLLNTALTTPRGDAGRHLSQWKPFTERVIRALDRRDDPVVWVLWGRKAQWWRKLIDPGHPVVTAPHPAARGVNRTEFVTARTFSRVNDELAKLGCDAIRWSTT